MGFPVCLQRIVNDRSILDDFDRLDGNMDLQLVLLTISDLAHQRGAQAEWLEAARWNLADTVRFFHNVKRPVFEGSKTACYDHLEVARLLLSAGAEHGADKDCTDRGGKTALMHASQSGSSDIARLLLEASANQDCWDRDGMTALMLASWSGHLEVAKDCAGRGGKTALMRASQSGSRDIARLLLEASADKD